MRVQRTKQITIDQRVWDDVVDCPVCGKEISLKTAWFDPYCKTHVWDKIKEANVCHATGAQVCREHLSEKRKMEIEQQHEFMRKQGLD